MLLFTDFSQPHTPFELIQQLAKDSNGSLKLEHQTMLSTTYTATVVVANVESFEASSLTQVDAMEKAAEMAYDYLKRVAKVDQYLSTDDNQMMTKGKSMID